MVGYRSLVFRAAVLHDADGFFVKIGTFPKAGDQLFHSHLDDAGWELVIEVRGVNVSALIDAMPNAAAAILGAEEELLRVFEDIDLLLAKSITEDDKLALQTRRRELLNAYRSAAAAKAFSLEVDENPFFDGIEFKKVFRHLFGEEEAMLVLNGHKVEFELTMRVIPNLQANETYRLLAETQGKIAKDGYTLTVYRSITSPDGMKKKEEMTLCSEVCYSFQLSDALQKNRPTFFVTSGEETEKIEMSEDGAVVLSFTSPFSFVRFVNPEANDGLGWQALVAVVVCVSLITSLSLAFFARFLVRRRHRMAENPKKDQLLTMSDEEQTASVEEITVESSFDELYDEATAIETAEEGFSLHDEEDDALPDAFEEEEDDLLLADEAVEEDEVKEESERSKDDNEE